MSFGQVKQVAALIGATFALHTGTAFADTGAPVEGGSVVPIDFSLPEQGQRDALLQQPANLQDAPPATIDTGALMGVGSVAPIDFSLPEQDQRDALLLQPANLQDTPPAPPVYGPPETAEAPVEAGKHNVSFGRQIGSMKWELGLAFGWMTVSNTVKVSQDGARGFRFVDEGWFGDNTFNLGMDKLAHAWNTYWLTDMIEARIRHKTGASNAALPAATMAMGLMLYSELWDAHKKTSGFSFQDLAMNAAGAGFSVLRNSVPKLDEKLDFRLQLTPNSDIYTFSGTRHYRQMRYLLALKLAGFKGMERSPLRFVELHAGYYATGFTAAEEQRGEERRQRPFVGIGINLSQLLFGGRRPSGWAGRAVSEGLQYLQVPYTAYHVD